MKIIINKKYFQEAPERFLSTRAGYLFIHDRHTGKESYIRTLTRNRYPRFHVYLKQADGRVIIDLHIDQKQASYQGSRMHNAEHEGDVVEREIARLKTLIMGQLPSELANSSSASEEENNTKSLEDKIGHGDFREKNTKDYTNKRGFFSRLFRR